jgi:NDP-sugar pyrophosphorylase family protein
MTSKAMILAAGYGTRLRPLTYTIPKPMLPVCNRPLIGYAVEGFIRAGVHDLIVNLHHLPESMEEYLPERYGEECHFHFSFEKEILGTGGAIRKVRTLLEREEDFFLVNGDTIQMPPWDELLRARRQRDALAALTLRHSPAGDRFTPVFFDDSEDKGFGKGRGEALMFSGSHVISSRIFRYLPDKDFSGIVDEVYQPLLDRGTETIAAVVDDGTWFDIGKPQRYLSASGGILDLTIAGEIDLAEGSRLAGDSIVDNRASIRGSVSRSSIGGGSVVEGEVRDSVVWENARIAAGVRLDSCIVADGVELSRPVQLRNTIVCRASAEIPDEPAYRREDDLVFAEI